ncbi:WD40-repeat-containing domain protein [Tribonema minus]|uniref:WD40-repeat-containing domain protein n=1 Tax=Tribonema minus TaxID=303371 RepID=A0A835YIA5_9STRA|nr:WD40-repeat-containing domain protein [Tribonema minus]
MEPTTARDLGLELSTAAPPEGAATPELLVQKQGQRVGTIRLHREITVLGRNSNMADEVLEHQSVSRRHAAILHGADSALYIADLGSVHGTFTGSTRLPKKTPVVLADGDVLRFGESSRSYTVQLPPPEKPAMIAPAPRAAQRQQQRPSSDDDEGNETMPPPQHSPSVTEPAAQAPQDAAAERERRRAEIAAVTAQLSAAPTFTRAVPEAAEGGGRNNGGGGEDSDEEEEEEEETPEQRARRTARRLELPLSHEAALKGHRKAVTALSVDPGGGRVATGGTDYTVRLYDFGGMDRHHRAFREVEPEDGHVVVALSHSGTGDRFLACTASAQPKVYDRDGVELAHFVRGDPYLRDMRQTKGHVTSVTCGQWHPSQRNTGLTGSMNGTVLTGSVDGTARVWDLNGPTTFDKLHCKLVLRVKPARIGGKVPVTSVCYDPDARCIAVGGGDGSVRVLPAGGGTGGSTALGSVAEAAHGAGSVVTCVAYHEEGHLLASRGTDDCVRLWDVRKFKEPIRPIDCVRLWDVRKFKEPIRIVRGVGTHMETSNVAFSPDGRTLAVGTNAPPKSTECGGIKFFPVYGAVEEVTEPELQISVAAAGESVVRVLWHPKLKQILASTTGGYTKVLYDPAMSVKGAMMTSQRTHRAATTDYVPDNMVGVIHNPYALPMYREEHTSKRKLAEQARKDPKRSRKPEPPLNGPTGAGGRVSSSTSFTQFVMSNKLLNKPKLREQDPRAELLKVASAAEADPAYFGAFAWNKAPLASKTIDEEAAEFEEEQKRLLDS